MIENQIEHEADVICERSHVIPCPEIGVDLGVVDDGESSIRAVGAERQNMHDRDGLAEVGLDQRCKSP